MKKFIPKEKLGKKARKQLDSEQRTTWAFSPVTKKVESKKLYNRKRKAHDRYDDYGMGFSYGLIQRGEGSSGLLCATCILGTNLICQRFRIVPSITRQLFIRPEYEKVHTIYQRFSYTRDDLIVDEYSNRPE